MEMKLCFLIAVTVISVDNSSSASEIITEDVPFILKFITNPQYPNDLPQPCKNRSIEIQDGKTLKILVLSDLPVHEVLCLLNKKYFLMDKSHFNDSFNNIVNTKFAIIKVNQSMNGEWSCTFEKLDPKYNMKKTCLLNVTVLEELPLFWIYVEAGAGGLIILVQCIIILCMCRKPKAPELNIHRLSALRESSKQQSDPGNVYEDITRRPSMPVPKKVEIRAPPVPSTPKPSCHGHGHREVNNSPQNYRYRPISPQFPHHDSPNRPISPKIPPSISPNVPLPPRIPYPDQLDSRQFSHQNVPVSLPMSRHLPPNVPEISQFSHHLPRNVPFPPQLPLSRPPNGPYCPQFNHPESPVVLPPKPRSQGTEQNVETLRRRYREDFNATHRNVAPPPPPKPSKIQATNFAADNQSEYCEPDILGICTSRTNVNTQNPKFSYSKTFNSRDDLSRKRYNPPDFENERKFKTFTSNQRQRTEENMRGREKLFLNSRPNFNPSYSVSQHNIHDSSYNRSEDNHHARDHMMKSTAANSQPNQHPGGFNSLQRPARIKNSFTKAENNLLLKGPVNNAEFLRKLATITASNPNIVDARVENQRVAECLRDSIYEQISDEEYWET